MHIYIYIYHTYITSYQISHSPRRPDPLHRGHLFASLYQYLSLSLYISIYIHIHTYIYIYIYIFIHTYVYSICIRTVMQCNIRGEGSRGDSNYYNFANYNCRRNNTNLKSKHEFHPSGKMLYVCLNVAYSELPGPPFCFVAVAGCVYPCCYLYVVYMMC